MAQAQGTRGSRPPGGKAEVSGHHIGPRAHTGETRVTVGPDSHRPPIPLRLLTGFGPRHHNLTSWSPSVHFLFARRYRRRGQTVLAHHGLQADRPSEAALIAAGKRSTEICSFDTDSRSRRRGSPSPRWRSPSAHAPRRAAVPRRAAARSALVVVVGRLRQPQRHAQRERIDAPARLPAGGHRGLQVGPVRHDGQLRRRRLGQGTHGPGLGDRQLRGLGLADPRQGGGELQGQDGALLPHPDRPDHGLVQPVRRQQA